MSYLPILNTHTCRCMADVWRWQSFVDAGCSHPTVCRDVSRLFNAHFTGTPRRETSRMHMIPLACIHMHTRTLHTRPSATMCRACLTRTSLALQEGKRHVWLIIAYTRTFSHTHAHSRTYLRTQMLRSYTPIRQNL